MLPTTLVPVATVLGGVERDNYEVAGTGVDVMRATRADVGLAGLERVDEADVECVVVGLAYRGNAAHSTSSATTTNAAITST